MKNSQQAIETKHSILVDMGLEAWVFTLPISYLVGKDKNLIKGGEKIWKSFLPE
jgi:hypothetical protein